MVVACLRKLGEEVDAVRVGFLVVGKTETLDLLDLCGSLVGSVQGEEGDGVDTLVQADALCEEADGVLPEKTVEDRNLTDLKRVSMTPCMPGSACDDSPVRHSQRTCPRSQ